MYIKITAPSAFARGEIVSLTLVAQSANSNTDYGDMDTFKLVCVGGPIVEWSDIQKRAEDLSESEILNPDAHTYDAQTVAEEIVKLETEKLLPHILDRLDSVTIGDYYLVFNYILHKTIYELLTRGVMIDIGGGGSYVANMNIASQELQNLWNDLQRPPVPY